MAPAIETTLQDNQCHHFGGTKKLALMADQVWPPDKRWIFYAAVFLRATPIRPNRPEPNNHTAAGTGT